MKSIIKNLTPEQKEALFSLCEECDSYKEACAFARDKLGIQLSPGTCSRFYTTYKIADDAETRADYASAAGVQPHQLLKLTENQLQLRLLELASRPNPGASDLRALFQIVTRLRALALSTRRAVVAERRIALAEKRDERENQPPPPQPSASPLEIKRRVKLALGKPTEEIDAEIARQSAANAARPAPTPAPDPAADNDNAIPLSTKYLLGKDISLGDELLSDPFFTQELHPSITSSPPNK
jgi:hypothetical protein